MFLLMFYSIKTEFYLKMFLDSGCIEAFRTNRNNYTLFQCRCTSERLKISDLSHYHSKRLLEDIANFNEKITSPETSSTASNCLSRSKICMRPYLIKKKILNFKINLKSERKGKTKIIFSREFKIFTWINSDVNCLYRPNFIKNAKNSYKQILKMATKAAKKQNKDDDFWVMIGKMEGFFKGYEVLLNNSDFEVDWGNLMVKFE